MLSLMRYEIGEQDAGAVPAASTMDTSGPARKRLLRR